MRTAVVAFGDAAKGDDAIGLEVVARLRQGNGARDVGDVVAVDGGSDVLRTLESVCGFDGLIIVDAASMGLRPGAFTIININDLILDDRLTSIKLHGMRIDSELIYAHKFLDLPPTRLVLIQPDTLAGGRISETLQSSVEDYLDAVRQAIAQLK